MFNLKKAKAEIIIFFHIAKTNFLLSKPYLLLTTIYDITIKFVETYSTRIYNYLSPDGRLLQVSHATLLNYINKNKSFKGKYIKRKNTLS